MIKGRKKVAVRQYQDVDVGTGVSNADPHQLVLMLMDGAMKRMLQAKELIKQKDVVLKIEAMTRAIEIVDSLRASLNYEQGGALVENLDMLYDYMVRELVVANSKNDTKKLDHVMALLEEVRGAWRQMGDQIKKPADSQLMSERLPQGESSHQSMTYAV